MSTNPTLIAPFKACNSKYYFYPRDDGQHRGLLRTPRLKHFPSWDQVRFDRTPIVFHGFAKLHREHPHYNHYAYSHLLVVDIQRTLHRITPYTQRIWTTIRETYSGFLALEDIVFMAQPATCVPSSKLNEVSWPAFLANLGPRQYEFFDKYAPPDFNSQFLRAGYTITYAGLLEFGEDEKIVLLSAYVPRYNAKRE